MPKTKRCIIGDAARHTTQRVTGSESIPAVGFRKGSRLTAVGIHALGDSPLVTEGIGDGFRGRLTAVGIVALFDSPLVTEGIGGRGFRLVTEGIGAGGCDAGCLCPSGSSTPERDRKSGAKNCKSLHDYAPFGCRPSPKKPVTISHSQSCTV